jgi:HPt (histidine-containing phosphotransfer) domain-containing protein
VSTDLPIIDHAVLDELRQSVGGDEAFVIELATTYLAEGEGHIQQVADALANGDIAGMVRPAHTLKSSSAALGAARLADISREIEHAAREERTDGLDAAVADARAAWAETAAQMRAMGLEGGSEAS